MLYNKNWDKPEVKADPFSLESLIAWLEKQPADKGYSYSNGISCLLGQWLRTIDSEFECQFNIKGIWTYTVLGKDTDFEKFSGIAFAGSERDTFGAALARAKALAER